MKKDYNKKFVEDIKVINNKKQRFNSIIIILLITNETVMFLS